MKYNYFAIKNKLDYFNGCNRHTRAESSDKLSDTPGLGLYSHVSCISELLAPYEPG